MVMQVMLIICRFNRLDAPFVSFCEEIQSPDLYFSIDFPLCGKNPFFFDSNRAEKGKKSVSPINED